MIHCFSGIIRLGFELGVMGGAFQHVSSFDNVVFGCELSHFAKCRGLSAISIKAIILVNRTREAVVKGISTP